MALEIQSEQTDIDGIEFEVQQLPSTASKKLFERLVRAVGPALAQIEEKDIGKALETLFERLTPKDSEEVERVLLEKCQVKVEDKWIPLKGVYELIFAGKIDVLYRLIGFALALNYRSFWKAASGGGSLLAMAQSALSSRLGSPKTGPISASSPQASPPSKS